MNFWIIIFLKVLVSFIVIMAFIEGVHYFEDKNAFIATLERWRDLYTENFLIAEDKQGSDVGCVAPWSPQQIQKVYAVRYGDTAQNLKDILTFGSWFGVSHTLPRTEGELKVRHLTHLYARNPDVMYALMYNAYKQSAKDETLVYPHFEGDLMTLAPKGFISASQNFGLYCILSPTDPLPDFLKPKFMAPPIEFEPAFL